MRPVECLHEDELVDAIRTGRWPERADAELAAHVPTCVTCRDVAAVATAILDASAAAEPPSDVSVPDAGAVWLRAQWRARADAARQATHPITVAQATAIGCLTALGGALFGATAGWFQRGLGGLARVVWSSLPDRETVSSAVVANVGAHLTVALTLGVIIVTAPIVAVWMTRD